jgi:hypothetical protein
MVFHLPAGSILSRSRKSILPAPDFPRLDLESLGSLVATDSAGRDLTVHHLVEDGWHKVDIGFANSSTFTPEYTVHLNYTILQSICSTAEGLQRIDLAWAHKWDETKVTRSRYEIEFVDSETTPSMDSICFGFSGRGVRCGRSHLDIQGDLAGHEVDGILHGAFFSWKGVGHDTAPRQCAAQDANQPSTPSSKVAENAADARADADEKPDVAPMAIFASVGSAILGVAICCVCRVCCSRSKGDHHKGRTVGAPSADAGNKTLLGRLGDMMGKNEDAVKNQTPACEGDVDLEKGRNLRSFASCNSFSALAAAHSDAYPDFMAAVDPTVQGGVKNVTFAEKSGTSSNEGPCCNGLSPADDLQQTDDPKDRSSGAACSEPVVWWQQAEAASPLPQEDLSAMQDYMPVKSLKPGVYVPCRDIACLNATLYAGTLLPKDEDSSSATEDMPVQSSKPQENVPSQTVLSEVESCTPLGEPHEASSPTDADIAQRCVIVL